MTTCNRRAFTIVELLIVIAIIGLLVSLTIPALSKAKVLARHTACRTNLHAVAVGFRMYLNDSGDIMPVAAQLPSAQLNDDPPICEVMTPYLGDLEVLHCPADTERDYFASEGSSYEYHSILGGRNVDETFLTQMVGEANVHIMHDYEPFHGKAGQLGASNYLFADGHVGDLE